MESCTKNESTNLGTLPKHIPFPEIPHSSESKNEFITFFFVIFTTGMQYLHIYRTVWWLPEYHTNQIMKFYLIDPYLVIFILAILSRRFLFTSICKTLEILKKNNISSFHYNFVKYTYALVLMSVITVCIFNFNADHSYRSLCVLIYPLLVYFFVFGLQMDTFFRTSSNIDSLNLNGMPMHCCSNNPNIIRDEIDYMKNDFNFRLKQVMYMSIVNAYYAGFVPCFFAQSFVYYNLLWAIMFTIFIWIGGFTMGMSLNFPAKYCDVLHRSALHLGNWLQAGNCTLDIKQHNSWSKNTLWPPGSVVRYSGELFIAEGLVISAIPGNSSQASFYKLFSNPSILYLIQAIIQISLVAFEIFVLYLIMEWQFVLSITFLILMNYHTLLQIIRNLMVTQKIYATEFCIFEKMENSS